MFRANWSIWWYGKNVLGTLFQWSVPLFIDSRTLRPCYNKCK